jgi:putative protease
MLEIMAKNKFLVGDELELLSPQGNQCFRLEKIEDLNGNAMQEVPGGGWEVRIKAPEGEYEMGLLTRFL